MPEVVTCVLTCDDKILILKRSQNVGTYKGKWGGISGYVEKNEKPLQTAKKEIKEEAGLEKEDIKFIRKEKPIEIHDVHNKKEYNWIIHPFLFSTTKKNIKIDWENGEYKWIFPDEITKYQTVPGLKEIIHKLLKVEDGEAWRRW